MDDAYQPTPEDLAAFHEAEDFGKLDPHQRDAVVRLTAQEERREAWAEEDRDWVMSHPELFDGDEE